MLAALRSPDCVAIKTASSNSLERSLAESFGDYDDAPARHLLLMHRPLVSLHDEASFVVEFMCSRLRVHERFIKAEQEFVEQALMPSISSLIPSVVDTLHDLVLNFK